MWRDALHARLIDPQFLAEHRDFKFELMDPALMNIAVVNQRFTTHGHGDSHDPDEMEHRTSNE